jgi:long-chain acyl-CoA synthetase
MERPWFKFYDACVPRSLSIPDISLPKFFDAAAGKFPRRPALLFFGSKMSYGELQANTNRFANALQTLGIKKGDHVGILLANMPQTVISTFGILKAGGVAVFFDPLIEPEEIRRQINDSGVETLVLLDLILPRVEKVFGQTRVKKFIFASVKDYLSFPRDFFFSLAAKGRGLHVKVVRKGNCHLFKEMVMAASPVSPPADLVPTDVHTGAIIQYTSGTEGPSKGVVLTHKNVVANTLQAASWYGNMEEHKEAFLSILPIHHVYGMTLAMNLPIHLGATSVHLPRFDPTQATGTIRKHRLTFFPAAPSMVESLSTFPGLDRKKVHSLKFCWAIGGSLSEEAVQGFERIVGKPLIPAYGLTETSALTHAAPKAESKKSGSIGIPLPNTDARVVNPEDHSKILPVGEPGELVVQGPQVMKGYWNNEEATAKAMGDGWLHTGDLARMDEDGYFYILGRVRRGPPP